MGCLMGKMGEKLFRVLHARCMIQRRSFALVSSPALLRRSRFQEVRMTEEGSPQKWQLQVQL